jgi:hypothetical protein
MQQQQSRWRVAKMTAAFDQAAARSAGAGHHHPRQGDTLMTSRTAHMREIALGITNYDHTIAPGLAEALRHEPGQVYGCHTAWDFYGLVWFADGRFHEEVWVLGAPEEVLSAPTLEALMEAVNAKYGGD